MTKERIITILRGSVGKYLAVGVISVAVDYGLLLVLYRGLEVNLVTATSVSFLFGLVVNFLLNKLWAFGGAETKTAVQVLLYGALVCLNLIFTNIFILILNNYSVGPEISKPIATVITVVWNYIIYKKLIFATVKS